MERSAGEAALRFAGDAYYAVNGGRLSGTWFDSEGNVHALQARATDGALEVVDEAKGGSFRELARMRYQRK